MPSSATTCSIAGRRASPNPAAASRAASSSLIGRDARPMSQRPAASPVNAVALPSARTSTITSPVGKVARSAWPVASTARATAGAPRRRKNASTSAGASSAPTVFDPHSRNVGGAAAGGDAGASPDAGRLTSAGRAPDGAARPRQPTSAAIAPIAAIVATSAPTRRPHPRGARGVAGPTVADAATSTGAVGSRSLPTGSRCAGDDGAAATIGDDAVTGRDRTIRAARSSRAAANSGAMNAASSSRRGARPPSTRSTSARISAALGYRRTGSRSSARSTTATTSGSRLGRTSARLGSGSYKSLCIAPASLSARRKRRPASSSHSTMPAANRSAR